VREIYKLLETSDTVTNFTVRLITVTTHNISDDKLLLKTDTHLTASFPEQPG